MRRRLPLALFVFFVAWSPGKVVAKDQPVQVYILAGQSNMDGFGGLEPLEHQAKHGDKDRQEAFAHLVKDDGYAKRDDVWVTFQGRKGPLTAGFGVNPGMFGVEWDFGNVLGEHHDAKVLLIKTSWGGASIRRKFRPPSSSKPTALIDQEYAGRLESFEKQAKEKQDPTKKPKREEVERIYGENYRKMVEVVRETLGDIPSVIPSYAGEGYEIAGFVWFQGWNDQSPEASKEYELHLTNLIRDVRQEFKVPKLPVVVGQMGHGGTDAERKKRGLKPTGEAARTIKEAQAKVCALKENAGCAALVKTDQFWDWKAQAVFDKGWREHFDEWRKIGAHFPFHYLGSPYFFSATGRAFGEAMVGLHES